MFKTRQLLVGLVAMLQVFLPLQFDHQGLKHSVLAANSKDQDAPDKLFMWKVSSPDSSVYVVGSIHMVRPDFYPLPKAMDETFNKSSILVLEIDESKNDSGLMQTYAAKAGVYTDGDCLDNHISKATKDALREWLADESPKQASVMQKMKPWLASIMIPVSELKRRGFDPMQGIDKHFLEQAHEQSKKVEELESAEFQLKALSGFPEELQDKLLLSALLDAENTDRDVNDLVSAWKKGDLGLMNDVVLRSEKEHPELKPVMNKLLYERNVGMAEKIGRYLDEKKTAFVVVGAGHLGGSKGILPLLKARNFKVEQVEGSN